MRHPRTSILATALAVATVAAPAAGQVEAPPSSEALIIESASVTYDPELDILVFEQIVTGQAGSVIPEARGQLHEAPVLGYVFPTTLEPADVGFGEVEGIVALAATSHPDFDDTPLWDESLDGDYANDGVVFHSHWVVLGPDERVPGGLSVVAVEEGTENALPPTSPGMPIYLDSPGHPVILRNTAIRLVVPAGRVGGRTDFEFDAVSAYMEVNTDDPDRPMLGVYEVYSVLSGDLSLPFEVDG